MIPSVPSTQLDVRIERSHPPTLPPDSVNAVFLLGTCFHPLRSVQELEVVVAGESHPVTAHGMPRIDVFQEQNPPNAWGDDAAPSAADPYRHSYRSGFWATVPVRMPERGSVDVRIRASLDDGTVEEFPLEPILAAEGDEPALGDGVPSASLAVCMATFEPDEELLATQIESIRGQTDQDWICLISDDASSPESYERLLAIVGDDPRFVVSRSRTRLGFYRNFERALHLVPAGVELIALSDQDDRWYEDKLATLRAALGDAQLVYSDQRIVDRDGNVVAPTYWSGERANNHSSLASLLVANTITGAASLFRRELLGIALPFPDPPGQQYHDQWLGLAALSIGKIAYVDRPLYDYVQHHAAALGHEGANTASEDARPRGLRGLLSSARGSRAAYFFAYTRIRLLAETLLLRGSGRIAATKARTLRRMARAESSPLGIPWLLARGLRRHFGRTETMGAERLLVHGLAWRPGIAAIARLRGKPIPGLPYDARLPVEPGARIGDSVALSLDHEPTKVLGSLVEPLRLEVSAEAPERVNLLIPTIELRHFFGGYITKFNLARRLSESGVRTRILTVDPTPPLPGDWRERVEGYAGLDGLFEHIEVAFARDRDAPVEISPRDRFIATTWWTAHIAAAAVEQTEHSRFLYLIQEFEPYTHPMGSWAAYAWSTYDLPHVAMFSTGLLRDFFAERRHGVFAGGRAAGERDSMAFQNAITAVEPPPPEELAERERKTLLFYARPESHGARNMFELGMLGLSEAIARGVFDDRWEFHGIGSVEGRDREVSLPRARTLKLLSKRDQGSYAELLTRHDAGLALMATPHPSLVPLEMASAGMLTVTNSFETKTADAMGSLSGNLITIPPSVDGVVEGLRRAAEGIDDYESRVRDSEVEWSRDWEQSFGPAVMARVIGLLDAC